MTTSLFHGIAQVSLVLVLMVGLIFALAWLAKKTQSFGFQGGKHLTLLQTLPLGQKEKAVLIEVGGTKLLLGVTATQVSTLWTAPVKQDNISTELAYSETHSNNEHNKKSEHQEKSTFSGHLKSLLAKNLLTKDVAC